MIVDVASLLQFADREAATVPATDQTGEREAVFPARLTRLARCAAVQDGFDGSHVSGLTRGVYVRLYVIPSKSKSPV